MKKGDIIYVPQNTRCLMDTEGHAAGHIATSRTSEPLRGIWLASADDDKFSKIFLDGVVVYIKSSDVYEWRDNVRSSESGEGFRPQFFSKKSLCKQ